MNSTAVHSVEITRPPNVVADIAVPIEPGSSSSIVNYPVHWVGPETGEYRTIVAAVQMMTFPLPSMGHVIGVMTTLDLALGKLGIKPHLVLTPELSIYGGFRGPSRSNTSLREDIILAMFSEAVNRTKIGIGIGYGGIGYRSGDQREELPWDRLIVNRYTYVLPRGSFSIDRLRSLNKDRMTNRVIRINDEVTMGTLICSEGEGDPELLTSIVAQRPNLIVNPSDTIRSAAYSMNYSDLWSRGYRGAFLSINICNELKDDQIGGCSAFYPAGMPPRELLEGFFPAEEAAQERENKRLDQDGGVLNRGVGILVVGIA